MVHRPSLWAGSTAVFILCVITAIRLLGDRLYDFPDSTDISQLPRNVPVVCLAGGKGRIEVAFALYASGIGEALWLIGAGHKATLITIARKQAPELFPKISPLRSEKILIETESRNTVENAYIVDKYLQQNPQFNKVILVTASYHMKRAMLRIQRQAHREITIVPHASNKEGINRQNWWITWRGIELTTSEVAKLIFADLFPYYGHPTS